MSGKITFEVTRGALAGQKFEYSEKTRVFIGRQDDCEIILPESTVSRYHCVLEITPPEVKLQDFGSLNGTFLNGTKIGQRDQNQSLDDAKNEKHDEYTLHNGDMLGLGNKCELRCIIEGGELCSLCGAELPEGIIGEETVLECDERVKMHYNTNGKRICDECWITANKPKQKKCADCDKLFTPTVDDNSLCAECMSDRAKVLDEILKIMLGMEEPTHEKPVGPSPLKGFQKIKLLGKGGMGEVWKVQEIGSEKYYALKTMLPEVKADPNAVKLFLRESNVGEVLNHKNVVKTYQSGCSNGTFYILMDLCEGGSVDGLMEKRGGKLPIELATWIILQALTGLDYVHNVDIEVAIKKGLFGGTKEVSAKGVVHRDFKPGNIFISDTSDRPIAMVADLGMAKAFDLAGLSKNTKSGQIMGTPVFIPRQQAMNFKYAKPEVDVWAAAASYYNMLTGAFPKNFRPGKNVWQIIITEPAVPIRERNSDIPQSIATVIDKALCENPSIGYQTVAAFRNDLVAALPSKLKNAVKGVI